MTAQANARGGAPVGLLADLGPVEAGAVLCLRLWCDGPEGKSKVWSDFSAVLGPERGRRMLRAFEELCDLCVRHGRRPLMRHHISCKCLGADEACFANFVASAAEGAREDAMLIATLLVRPGMAPSLVSLAQDVGIALRGLSLHEPPARRPAPHPLSSTLH